MILALLSLVQPELLSNNRSAAVQRSLYAMLQRHKAAAILLYAGVTKGQMQPKQRGRTPLQQAYAALAGSGYYPKKALLWASIDVNSPAGKTFIQDYGVVVDHLPALILLRDGVVVRDQQGIVIANKETSRAQLKTLIDDYLQLDIAQYVQEERLCKQYERVVRDRVHMYYMSYFDRVANPWNDYWGWPYYGQAQGNYGGNAGVNFTPNGINFFGSNY
jgi:hypothetical protein